MRAHDELAAAGGLRQPLEGDHLVFAAEVLRHLADPTRLRLLWLLIDGPQDVNALTARGTASRSSVSQHLGRLRHAGLVRATREGRHMRYRLVSDHLERLVAEAYRFADHLAREIPHHRRGER